jgi:hypothetical protein
MTDFKHTTEPWVLEERELQMNMVFVMSETTKAQITALLNSRIGRKDAKRIIECVNAMAGIESPQKLREAWDAVKHLKLYKYHRIEKEHKRTLKKIGKAKAVINGSLDGLELDNTLDVIEKSTVISILRNLITILENDN